ncbi:MAG: YggT family protein [Gammaproteobacteria bacterium]
MAYFLQALVFLVQTLFGLYLIALVLRFLLQILRADFHSPIARVLVTVTNPPLRPLRRLIPGYGGIDWALLVLTLLVQLLELILIGLLLAGQIPPLSGLLIVALGRLLRLVIYIFMFVIIIQVVLSWVNPHAYNAATRLIYNLSEPLLQPVRRLLPALGGIDLSPLVVIIGLNLLLILLAAPILDYGYSISGPAAGWR